MSGYKSFAVAGAGNIGKYIVKELAELKRQGVVSDVKVLTRSTTPNAEATGLGAESVTVDYTSSASLVSALKGVDVVISTLGGPALADTQSALALAAKEAGAKLFIPSDFGNSTEGATEGIFAVKENLRLKLLEIGLPYAIFYTGPFPDFVFVPFLGFDLPNGKAAVGGSGDTLISFTARSDIARFVAHVLTSLPVSHLENKIFRIEGERTSFNAILKEYTARTGTQITTTHLSQAELEEKIKANPHDFGSILHLEWDKGNGVVGKLDELSNGLYKAWEPKKAVDAILGA